MKKIIRIIAAALVAATLVFPLTSCVKEKLAAPTGLSINYDYVSTWAAIEDARRYELKITETGTQTEKPIVSTNKASYDLSKLSAGTYKVVVRAIAGDSKHKDSEWSAPLEFTRDPETGCAYTLINNGSAYEVTGCSAAVSENIVIEDVYRGKPVVSIGDYAFKSSSAESITIGKNVTSIGVGAFSYSVWLKKVVLPADVAYIGAKAFMSCRELKEVNIPEKVTEINENTFAYCSTLPSIKLHDKITSIAYGAFQGCKSLTEITIPDSVTSIGERCFYDAEKLASVKLGSGLTNMEQNAFSYCVSLKKIEFAQDLKLKTLPAGAFSATGFETFTVPEGITELGENCFDSAASLASVSIADSVERIGRRAFYRTKFYDEAIDYTTGKPKESGLREVFLYADKWLVAYANGVQKTEEDGTITGGLTELSEKNLKIETVGIADRTFAYNKTLAKLSGTENLKYIGEGAFVYCTSLEQARVPYAVEIGKGAFLGCSSLAVVDFTYNESFKSNLKRIGSNAFYGCTDVGVNTNSIAKMVPSSVESIGSNAFKNTYAWENDEEGVVYVGSWIVGYTALTDTNVTIKPKTVGIAEYAFNKCDKLQGISGIATEINYIGRGAFSGCSALQAVNMKSSVTEVQPYTFYKCESLYSVGFALDTKTIGDYAFYGSGLLSVDLTDCNDLESIGAYAFFGCNKIKELKLSKNLKTIGNYAFANRNPYRPTGSTALVSRSNEFLTEIVIPDSVTVIGNNAFANYAKVTNVKLGTGIKSIGIYAFKNCAALSEITLPDGVTSVGKSVFYKDAAVTKVNFGKNIDEIGDYAFYGMEKVEKLILPQGIKSIGKYAFLRWKTIKTVVISKDIEVIGDHAFNACDSTTFYTDASSLMPKWSKSWNSSFRPVVWNCALSEDKTYVVSVTITKDGISNPLAKGGISAPEREGYSFAGWTTKENSTEIEFSASDITKAEEGVTLYAVWVKAE